MSGPDAPPDPGPACAPAPARTSAPDWLQTLTQWLSPGYPLGSFAYSHGLEWAVEAGDVRDADAFRDWLAALLAHGAGRTDAMLLAAAWRDPEDPEPAALARALAASSERRLEAEAPGAAFARTTVAIRGHSAEPAPLPVALGRAAGREGMPLETVATLYLHAFAANLTSAAQRLVPLGQTEAQAALSSLAPLCAEVAAEAIAADPDDLGGACLRGDLSAMLHETQRTRLFRS
ncbi:MAG: urease accessory UreF family protein [Pseudomonadota bacterium]|nr:urease accessory UreF family protein [Pseudomonadota bacterium]MEE3101463.1 urease accessory UreF family protein [Pseudomonadota bacterium]